MGYIYKITNLVNNKVYIGLTKGSIEERFKRHCWGTSPKDRYHLNMAIKMAIKKYGKLNFRVDLLEVVDNPDLDAREKYWIAYYDSYNKGYNCTLGGQNGATRQCKLTNLLEEEIISRKLNGSSSKELAEFYNVDKTTIKNIFKRHGIEMPNRRHLSSRVEIASIIEYSKAHSKKLTAKHFNICIKSVYNILEYNTSKSVQTLPSNVEG